jgi:putative ABC transport system permease protein
MRLFRREWRQQLLVLTLLTVAVAFSVTGATSAVHTANDRKGRFGDASAIVHINAADPARAIAGLADLRTRFGTIDPIGHASVDVPGAVEQLDVRDQDPAGPYSAPMLRLLDGRYPTAPGDAALTRGAMRLLGSTLGASISLGGKPATVVGLVENPGELRDEFALVAPGALDARSYQVLVDVADPFQLHLPNTSDGPGYAVESGGVQSEEVTALVLSAGTLAMTFVGLIAASGFVVVAQRRQRQLGLLGAIGATDGHVRLVMIANGAIVGVVAAIVGVALGIGGWLVAAPAVESAAAQRIDRSALPWALVAGFAALSIVVATAAAWWPARAASRLPVMTALSGRPVPPRPVRRSLAVALVLVGGGVVAIAFSRPDRHEVRPLLLIGGLLAVVLGTVFAAPTAIKLIGAAARRLPFAPRLAVRDLARYQARAAASLSAITLGLSIAVAIAVVASASIDRSSEGNLAKNQLLIRPAPLLRGVGDVMRPAGSDDRRDATDLAQHDADAKAVAAALGNGVTVLSLDVALTTASDGSGRPSAVALGVQLDRSSIELIGPAYVATPELLALYGIDPASIEPTTDLLTSRDESLRFVTPLARLDDDARTPVTERVDLPTHSGAPNSLITDSSMDRNGWTAQRVGWFVESDGALTADQIDDARAAAASLGLQIEVRDHHDDLTRLRTGATLAGGLLALAVVAMTLGLIRGESARDLRTLVATGAAPRTRRALTASTAAALAVPGVLLGTAGAYAALIAAYRSELGELTPVPLAHLGSLAAGLPLVAALAGWVLAGREPRSFARQQLD